MKHSKLAKILIIILISITLFLALTPCTLAKLHVDIGNAFEGTGDEGNATNTVTDILGKSINFIQIVGMGVAIIMLVVLGIRWMGAAPSGKAQIAKSSRYYIAGAIFIFAAIGLLQIVKTFTEGSFGNVV